MFRQPPHGFQFHLRVNLRARAQEGERERKRKGNSNRRALNAISAEAATAHAISMAVGHAGATIDIDGCTLPRRVLPSPPPVIHPPKASAHLASRMHRESPPRIDREIREFRLARSLFDNGDDDGIAHWPSATLTCGNCG